jgi:hypothetical protein
MKAYRLTPLASLLTQKSRSVCVQCLLRILTLPGAVPASKRGEAVMRKTVIRLGAGVLGAALLLPGMALAGHYGYSGPSTVTTITYSTSHVRGGPPAWAPAHGYRHKHSARYPSRHYKSHHRGYGYPVVVHRPPVYRAPRTVYHAPASRSTLDFTVRYSTQF